MRLPSGSETTSSRKPSGCRAGGATSTPDRPRRSWAAARSSTSNPRLQRALAGDWEPRERLVPDEVDAIAAAIRELADAGCCLVVTTGGTGPAPRDVTPEATERVCTKLLPGFGERMRQVSLQYVPTAILSRQTAGVCGRALVVNLPGRPKSIRECLDAVFPAIPYCVDLINTGAAHPPRLDTRPERLEAFRPPR